jgi:cell division protein FtsB
MLIMRLIERNQLRKNIIVLKTQNRYLKKKIFFLENNTYYLERIIRNELNMIAPGEIEYRFNLNTTVTDDENIE